ncbi:type II secretion system protein N [Desulfurivibrio sp. D14AmB]|uniref:type II secretion system protein N n=1 Tax=Desulfurivibrio sp. D14AmB TaxID=3374370 RepID=UPI00376F2F33
MKRYWLTAGLLFAFFLVYYLPAQLAWHFLQKQGVGLVDLHGINGPWHTGSAVSGQLWGTPVRDLSWRLRPLPWAPLRGWLQGAVGNEGRFEGWLQTGWRGPAGPVKLTAVEAAIPLSIFSGQLARQGLAVDGLVTASLGRLELAGATPLRGEGEIWLRGFRALQPMAMGLGDFRGEIGSDGDGLRVVLRDQGGPLLLEGLVALDSTRRYTLAADLSPRDPQNRELVTVLGFLGRPDRDGVTKLNLAGQL